MSRPGGVVAARDDEIPRGGPVARFLATLEPMGDELRRIGQLADRCGKTARALHLYEEMGLLKPFLTPGAEYDAITRYRNGFFLTDPPKDSELLNHGRHAGPALTEEQAAALLAWLELQVKTGAGQSLTTPSAALRSGDFFLSLERLVGDAQAKLTFSLDPLKTENAYLLRDLMLSVGPETGVRLTHPKVLLLSDAGVREDPADQDLVSLPSGHLFGTNVSRVAFRRGVYLREFELGLDSLRIDGVAGADGIGDLIEDKRGVVGTYHHLSEAHLHRYTTEFDFRYNTRKDTDTERADIALLGIEGKRLTYRRAGQSQAS